LSVPPLLRSALGCEERIARLLGQTVDVHACLQRAAPTAVGAVSF
jgi:hypothetical protein